MKSNFENIVFAILTLFEGACVIGMIALPAVGAARLVNDVAEHRTHIVTYYRGEDGEVREAKFCRRKGGLIKQAYYECRTENGMAKAMEYWEEEE